MSECFWLCFEWKPENLLYRLWPWLDLVVVFSPTAKTWNPNLQYVSLRLIVAFWPWTWSLDCKLQILYVRLSNNIEHILLALFILLCAKRVHNLLPFLKQCLREVWVKAKPGYVPSQLYIENQKSPHTQTNKYEYYLREKHDSIARWLKFCILEVDWSCETIFSWLFDQQR
jgi:hypothetical protein